MRSITGIFTDRAAAERAAAALRAPEVAGDRVSLLCAGASRDALAADVPTREGEQPGVGPTLGGVVGAAAGAAGGMHIATAAAVTLLPLGAPVIVTGLLAGALLGTGAGIAVGKALEDHLPEGLPKDELVIYEAALGQGRSVVIALVESDEQARAGRAILAAEGAERLDAARESPRVGLDTPHRERGAA